MTINRLKAFFNDIIHITVRHLLFLRNRLQPVPQEKRLRPRRLRRSGHRRHRSGSTPLDRGSPELLPKLRICRRQRFDLMLEIPLRRHGRLPGRFSCFLFFRQGGELTLKSHLCRQGLVFLPLGRPLFVLGCLPGRFGGRFGPFGVDEFIPKSLELRLKLRHLFCRRRSFASTTVGLGIPELLFELCFFRRQAIFFPYGLLLLTLGRPLSRLGLGKLRLESSEFCLKLLQFGRKS